MTTGFSVRSEPGLSPFADGLSGGAAPDGAARRDEPAASP
jgi:hypothetical protein